MERTTLFCLFIVFKLIPDQVLTCRECAFVYKPLSQQPRLLLKENQESNLSTDIHYIPSLCHYHIP